MGPIVVLSGAGLSAASGIPTFRGAGGLWEGHDAMQLATPEAWRADPDLVRRFYDARRRVVEAARPNAAHDALAHLQRSLGPERVVLVTQNVDGLLGDAGAPEVIEMHGSLRRLRCERHEDHPSVPVAGDQDPLGACGVCGAALRPAVVWFGEVPHALDRIARTLTTASRFVSVGTSGVVYPAAGFGQIAARSGVPTLEINPEPCGAAWVDEVLASPAEDVLPELVRGLVQRG